MFTLFHTANRVLRFAAEELGDHLVGGRGKHGLKSRVNRECLGSRIASRRKVNDELNAHRDLHVFGWLKRIRGNLRRVDPQKSSGPLPIGMGSSHDD